MNQITVSIPLETQKSKAGINSKPWILVCVCTLILGGGWERRFSRLRCWTCHFQVCFFTVWSYTGKLISVWIGLILAFSCTTHMIWSIFRQPFCILKTQGCCKESKFHPYTGRSHKWRALCTLPLLAASLSKTDLLLLLGWLERHMGTSMLLRRGATGTVLWISPSIHTEHCCHSCPRSAWQMWSQAHGVAFLN